MVRRRVLSPGELRCICAAVKCYRRRQTQESITSLALLQYVWAASNNVNGIDGWYCQVRQPVVSRLPLLHINTTACSCHSQFISTIDTLIANILVMLEFSCCTAFDTVAF